MPKNLNSDKPKRKSRAKPKVIQAQVRAIAKQRKNFIRGLKDAAFRPVATYTRLEIDKLVDDLLDCVLAKADRIWYRDWLAEQGIHADKLKALRDKFSNLDDTIKICDAILEGRLINIPSYKAAHQRHSEFMLRKFIGGIWCDQRSLTVDMSNTSIFNRLETSPIIQIRNDSHELANYETISLSNPNLTLMGPNSDDGGRPL